MANTRIGRAVLIRYIQSHGVLIIRALYLQRYAQRRPAMRRSAADRSPDNEVDERANDRSTRFGQLRKTLRGTIARESCAEQLRRTILLNVINGGLMPSVMFVNIAALMPDGRPLTPVVWLAIQHDWGVQMDTLPQVAFTCRCFRRWRNGAQLSAGLRTWI